MLIPEASAAMTQGVLQIDCVVLGEIQTNCYIVRPAGMAECWVIDPGMEPDPLLERLAELAVQPGRILVTHGHGDHIAGIAAVKRAYPAAVITAPAGDAAMLGDAWLNLSRPFGLDVTAPPAEQLVRPGDELTLGPTVWRVLDTSGHTPGGVSYHCPAAGVAIVGDALFAGSVGRCDIPGADFERLLGNIRRHLLSLPDDTAVLTGHGPATTVGAERRTNPFLRRPTARLGPQLT